MKLREKSNGEADVFPLAEGNMAATNRVSRVVATLPESKNSARSQMSSAREPGDLDGARQVMVTSEHPRKGASRKPGRRASEESDALVVPKKSANSRVTPEESMEGRGEANGNLDQRNASRAQDRQDAPRAACRSRQKAASAWKDPAARLYVRSHPPKRRRQGQPKDPSGPSVLAAQEWPEESHRRTGPMHRLPANAVGAWRWRAAPSDSPLDRPEPV